MSFLLSALLILSRGMKEKIQLLAAALALILLLCGCAARGTASNDAKPAAGDVTDSNAAPYEVPAFRDSVFNEDEATAFGSGEIDLSQLEGGIIGVKAHSDTRLKMQIVCGEDKYNYDLPNDGTATFFPLNMGNGTYTFRLSFLCILNIILSCFCLIRKPCAKFFCMAFFVDFFKKMRFKLLALYI